VTTITELLSKSENDNHYQLKPMEGHDLSPIRETRLRLSKYVPAAMRANSGVDIWTVPAPSVAESPRDAGLRSFTNY
jgi:hypothetical protein